MLLITGEDQDFLAGNKAFLDFASANKKEVLRFAYVYQRHQQPLCQTLLHNQAALSPQVSGRNACVNTQSHSHAPKAKCMIQLKPPEGKTDFQSSVQDNEHLTLLYADMHRI